MKKWVLIAVAMAATLLVGCQGGFSERVSAGKENTFRYPIPNNPTTLDPGLVQDGDTIDLLHQVFEGLVVWGENNEVVPAVAERWEVEDGGRTYRFFLKKGVKFHSGREVTAADFKWTMERNTNPAINSPTAANYLSDIVGVADRVAGKTDTISGIEVVNDHELVIRIDKPRPYFLGKLTYLVSAPLDKDKVPGDAQITSPDQMVGCGPFTMTQFVNDQLAVLSAFKDYHAGAPTIDRIERPVVKDAQTRLLKYRNGELDLVQLARQDLEAFQNDPKFKSHLRMFDRPAIWYVGLNQKAYPPFRDVRVRRAFAMAIDKDKIVNELLGGVNRVANSIVPPGIPGHRENANAIKFNVDEAKKLLADAGFPGGRGLPELTLSHREGYPDIRIVAEAVASQLKNNLGVNVQVRALEWGTYLSLWNKSELPIFHMRWAADYLDPENFLSFMLATYGPENKIGYANARFDALCREADSIMDQQRRFQLYAEAEDIALQEAPWIPIFFQRDAELISPRVQGLRESLFGHLPHATVRLTSATP